MSPSVGQAATRIALFLIICAVALLLWVPRNSAEFVVLVLTILVALAMLVVVAVFARLGAARWAARPRQNNEEAPKNGDSADSE